MPAALRPTWATRRRGLGEVWPRPRGCAHSAVPLGHTHPVPVGSPSLGAAATPRWRRRGVSVAQRPCTRLAVSPLQLGPSRPTPPSATAEAGAATASGAGRRLVPTASASAPRALLPPCGFSHRDTQRQWALLADNETAQALQHGCGEDCWRSASLAAPHARPRAALS